MSSLNPRAVEEIFKDFRLCDPEKKPLEDEPNVDSSSSKSRGIAKRKCIAMPAGGEGFEEEEDEEGETRCGSCRGEYSTDEFWICCDICEKWFHGKCVMITSAMADTISLYKCPSCAL